jgi:hypothetical protein
MRPSSVNHGFLAIWRIHKVLNYVTYYHVTPGRNLQSILTRGLMARGLPGQPKTIWLCSLAQSIALRDHLARHHRCGVSDLVCIAAQVRPEYLRQSRLAGRVTYRRRHIQPGRLRQLKRWPFAAGSHRRGAPPPAPPRRLKPRPKGG